MDMGGFSAPSSSDHDRRVRAVAIEAMRNSWPVAVFR